MQYHSSFSYAKTPSLKSFVAVAGLAAACCLAAESRGQTLNWNNVAGGSAGTAANWTPAQVPGPANPLVWNLANGFTTTFPGTVPQVISHTFKRGTVTLSMTSPHTTSSFVRVGDVAGDSATVILNDGTLHASTGVVVANASGATGTLTVDNEGALLDTVGAGSDIVVGSSGNGTLTISDGASAVVADDVLIGSTSTATGHVTVTGTGGLPLPIPPSTLDLTGAGKDVIVGQSGDGFLSVLSGGRVNVDEMFVGLNSGSNGTVTVGGSGGILNANAQINVATSLHLGDNPAIGLGAGSSAFTVNNGGVVNVASSTRIGDPAGVGSGTLSVNTGGMFVTGSLIATDTGGFLNMFGGQVKIDGGSFQPRNNVFTLTGSTLGSPVLVLDNGATCTLSNSVAPFEALVVGSSSAPVGCGVSVFNGSNLTISAGDVILGKSAGSSGSLNIRTASTVTMPTSRFFVVGDAGAGRIDLEVGAQMTTGTVNLGRTNTGTGLVNVTGDGSVWNINGALGIGGTSAVGGDFGIGTVTIGGAGGSPGGTVNIVSGGLTRSATVHGPGDSLNILEGGVLNADGEVVVFGDFTLDGGTVSVEGLQLETNNQTYRFRGQVSGNFGLNKPTSRVLLTGDLLHSGGLFANSGTFEIGQHTLSIDALNQAAIIDTCHLGSTGVLTSNSSGVVRSGKVLSGDGTIDARITNSGSIVSEGSGLTFTKVLSGIGQGISGTTITFRNGGGFTGSGAFSNTTPVSALAGSVITATGNLTMGSEASSSGYSGGSSSLVVAGDFDVTLNDSAQAGVGEIEFPNLASGSPSVRCNTGLAVVGSVNGTGTIGGDADSSIVVAGALNPGDANAPGTIFLAGDTEFGTVNSFAVFDIFDANSADKIETLTVTGSNPPFLFQSDIALDGTLVLRVSPSHTPTSREEHTLIRCGGSISSGGHISGSFREIIAPRHWIIVERHTAFGVGPDSLVAVFCRADFNEDSTVDLFDYLDFVDAFGAGAPASDFNSDAVIDFFDYLDFVDEFSSGCG